MEDGCKKRNTDERTDNVALGKIAKFASVWAEGTGIKWVDGEEIKGVTYAFNEQSEQIFNQLGALISNNLTDRGTINTRAIYEEISKGDYKYSEEIIDTLFANPAKLEIIYDFYKMQTPKARIETELSKTSTELKGKVNTTEYREAKAKGIVEQLNPGDITDSTLRAGIGREEISGVTAEIRKDQTRDLQQAQQK